MNAMNELWQNLSEYSIKLSKEIRDNPESDPKAFSRFFVVYKAYVEIGTYRQEAEDKGLDPMENFLTSMNAVLAEKETLVGLLRLDPDGLEVNAGMIEGYKAVIDMAEAIQAQ